MNSSDSSIYANINSISVLNGTNFKDFNKNVQIVLDCMDFNLALKAEQPVVLMDKSSVDEKSNFGK